MQTPDRHTGQQPTNKSGADDVQKVRFSSISACNAWLRRHWLLGHYPRSLFPGGSRPRDAGFAKPRALTALLMLGLLIATCPAAHAHQTKLSSSRLKIDGASAEAVLELNGVDLNVATGLELTGTADQVLPDRLRERREEIFAYVLERTSLGFVGAAQCEAIPGSIEAKADHVLISMSFRCPLLDAPLAYRVTLFHEVDPSARHIVTVETDRAWMGLLGAGNPVLELRPAKAGLWQTVWHYFLAGVEHIAIGYDHIAFLMAVIVLGRRFWPLFAVVTAFTVAHSITLSLAVLDVVTLPSRWVEIAIAASIVYVAAENFFITDIRRRWWLTFVFGLIHGFGFASVLREYGMPQDRIVPVLAAFNIGVEAGQLLIVLALVGIWQASFAGARGLGFSESEPAQRKVALVVSGLVLMLALYWLVQRFLA
jgi:hydrogenase/urease accessory protein HupE